MPTSHPTPPTPLRVGLVGLGRVALREHLPAIRQAGGEVAAMVDLVPGLARQRAAEYGVPYAAQEVERMLAEVPLDVVAVCTPPQAHREIALAALAAGRHVFLEKPPTDSAAAMAEVAEAARRANLGLLAGSHHPYRENVRDLRRRIAAGELGEVYAVDCLKLRRWAPPRDDGTAVQPSGVAKFSAVHRLDVVLYLLGLPRVRAVTARTYHHFAGQEAARRGVAAPTGRVEDSVVATIHFSDGCTLTLRDLQAAHMEEPNEMQCWFGDLRVFGTRAGARLHPLTLYRTDPAGGQAVEIPAVDNDLHAGHRPAYAYLFDCLRQGTRPAGTAERAVAVMRLVEAIYASAADHGRQVLLDPS